MSALSGEEQFISLVDEHKSFLHRMLGFPY